MDKEVVAALIALSGVVVSVIASIWVTRRDIRARNRDLFGSPLIQKRFEHYPELYRALSSFLKVLKDIPQGETASSFSNDQFRKFRNYILDWDSRYSYLMSDKCKDQWAGCYGMLEQYSADDLVKDPKLRQHIINMSMGIESALKSDLGVYTMDTLNLNKFHPYYPGTESPYRKSWRERAYWKLMALFPGAVYVKGKVFPKWEPFKKLINWKPSKKLIKR